MINILLMSVPHAGSTIIAKMIHDLGWVTDQGSPEYYTRIEWKQFVQINNDFNNYRREVCTHLPSRGQLCAALDNANILVTPDNNGWIVKDPRFCVCLPYWISAFEDIPVKSLGVFPDQECQGLVPALDKFRAILQRNQIVLMYLTKNSALVKSSHKKRRQYVFFEDRQEPGNFGLTVDQLERCADLTYDIWPGSKFHVTFEAIKATLPLFDASRDRPQHPMRGRAGWHSSPFPQMPKKDTK